MPQIEKPDDLQSIANHPVFLRMCDKSLKNAGLSVKCVLLVKS